MTEQLPLPAMWPNVPLAHEHTCRGSLHCQRCQRGRQHLSIFNITCAAADRRYIPLVKGSNFLRALRRCVSPTGDRTLYILNFVACPEGTTLEAILGYVR